MDDDRYEALDREALAGDQDADFESDADLEAALDERHSRFDRLRARGRHAVSRATERGRERLYEEADRRKGRVADVLDSAAGRLDARLTHGAEYLRTHDVDTIRDDLADQVRKHPLLSAGIALGAGYLIGRAIATAHIGRRRHPRRSKAGKQITRALLSTIGAAVAARVREGATSSGARDDIDSET